MSKYERLLFPHGRAHVEADCWVAFVPYEGSKHYRAVINGTELTGYVERSEALRGRMQRLGLGDQACLAAAKIRGGGLMPDGRRRAYFVAVDMKRFPGRALQHEVVRRRRRGNLSGSKERWTRHLATARAQGLH